MNVSTKIAYASAHLILVAGLTAIPAAAHAQQDIAAEYRLHLENMKAKTSEPRNENRDLRRTVERLGERVRCLELTKTPCLARTTESSAMR